MRLLGLAHTTSLLPNYRNSPAKNTAHRPPSAPPRRCLTSAQAARPRSVWGLSGALSAATCNKRTTPRGESASSFVFTPRAFTPHTGEGKEGKGTRDAKRTLRVDLPLHLAPRAPHAPPRARSTRRRRSGAISCVVRSVCVCVCACAVAVRSFDSFRRSIIHLFIRPVVHVFNRPCHVCMCAIRMCER